MHFLSRLTRFSARIHPLIRISHPRPSSKKEERGETALTVRRIRLPQLVKSRSRSFSVAVQRGGVEASEEYRP